MSEPSFGGGGRRPPQGKRKKRKKKEKKRKKGTMNNVKILHIVLFFPIFQ